MKATRDGAADALADRRRPSRSFSRAAALLLLGLLLGIGWWLQPNSADRSRTTAARIAAAPTAAVATRGSAVTHTRTPGEPFDSGSHWPVSLAGSVPDGEVEQDPSGRLRPSRELRRLFDYFLTAQGERELPAIRQLLQDHLQARYPTVLVAEVLVVFDQYLAYQAARATLPPETDLLARLDALFALRRRWFDAATAEAFFADEERMTRATLARLAMARNPDSDTDKKAAQLAALAAAGEQQPTTASAETDTALRVAIATEQLDAHGADAATRYAERAAQFGAAAAARLATLDADRAAWQARLAAYVEARSAIQRDPGLSASAMAAGIAALRASRFNPSEQRRIVSLEAIGQL